MKLKLTDTLTGQKQTFKPQHSNQVNLYVCGITPYAPSHIGHARSYINFDILVRTLRFLGHQVNYIRNFTDIDDKLLHKAEEQLGDKMRYSEVATKYMQDFTAQMNALNCTPPTSEPKATECIQPMIELVERLLAKDAAYKLGNDVYFDISHAQNYGTLAKKNIDELVAGSRVENVGGKRNPGDFVLWKGNSKQEFWATPFGYGRPGWHLECSAMIHAAAPQGLDIHGGGHDLIFPHHENEIAQSQTAYDYKLANFWLHNALLNLQQIKMSKSGDNSLNINDVLQKVSPAAFRLYILQHHYTTPIDFSFEKLQDSTKALDKLIKNFSTIPEQHGELDPEYAHALLDDLNTPKLLGLVFKNLDVIKNSPTQAASIKWLLQEALGLDLQCQEKTLQELSDEAQALLTQREQARADKNWALADELRDKIKALGHDVQDQAIKK